MYLKMAKRVLMETDKRLVWKLAYNFGFKGALSVHKHKKRLKRGEFFPPFLYVSVINSCNLRCQGCWVDVAAKQEKIDVEAMSKLIGEAKEMGNSFFGILGGEPFMHPQLLEILERHPDCYFQIFTNGQFITDEIAKKLRKLGNATPLISVEGNEIISNERRGRSDVYNKTMQGIQNCLNNKLLTGVCTSLCKSNIDDLLTEEWVDKLIDMGVMYTWYHIYRVAGPDPNPELALSPEEQLRARKFVVDIRARKPIGVIDAYFDHDGTALCPAATGLSHHINPWGDIEPCPVIQFATDSIHDESKTLKEKFVQSEFLKDFRHVVQQNTRGCIILERPDLLEDLVKKHGAKDSTFRKQAMQELQNLETRTSQYSPGNEVPEKSWVYRIAKKFFFNDFGVYQGTDHSQTAAPGILANRSESTTPGNPPDFIPLEALK
ncbi:MAG: radical SAM protein [Gimesia sp.]|uniref:Radical SAM protein n=2 Tax=Gimesia TaxID=1649453 RepID=A0A6I6AGX1_9PLAN|nr:MULTISPECIES: radical SAM/SPASM domain-containing protein [Gimesia]KAA0139928.1 radical SAM protein [Gimesia chilikensis]MBN70511.1 radical SAM protein [Gimesia sp.]QDT22809.1 pyrroloquinoline quinone biosynthesis protein PqqE [Gimesia chilikensis]QGQ25336.1 radical SAM protein [Gimesia benthica]